MSGAAPAALRPRHPAWGRFAGLQAAGWAGLEAGISALLSSLSAFVIARLVGPAELGIAAAALAPHVLLWIGVNALFADAIVQKAELSATDSASAFWAALAAGLCAALLQLAAGPVLAALFGDARLAGMSALLALPLPLVGVGGAMQGLLNRRRAFRALAGRAIFGQGIGTALGIALAWRGAGAWAVVGQQVATSTLGALVLLLGAGGRPRGMPRLASVRALLRVGLPLAASTLVLQARYRLFALLIGATAGPAALGEVHLAFRLVDTLRDLASTAQWRLLLPVMAERQEDLPALRRAVDRAAALGALVLLALCAALALSVRPLVALLLGPRWQSAAMATLPLIGLAAWQFLAFAGGVAAVARGYARAALLVNLAALAATVLGVLAMRPQTPMQAVLIWVGAAALAAPLGLGIAARALAWPVARSLRAALPALVLAGLAVGFGLLAGAGPGPLAGPALRLGMRLGVLGLAYGVGAGLLWRVGWVGRQM